MAIRFGREPEKLSAGAFVWLLVSSSVYRWLSDQQASLQSLDIGFFLIDVSVAAIMIVIALRANRMYTLWLAGFQIIATFAHLARGLTDAISPIAYAIMYIAPSYFQIIILAFGIWFHHKRVKRHGSYRSWRTSSPPSRDQRPLS
ncbi:hypothetical protein [Pontixanthobacter aestiaquae]|uniref:hypothetical protein n=1 Tax=Pontixanthobacter aestiaquae TaxID=1509367 RepID=UPI0013690A09|nr:hypothetical protein [Pontixanthobacter aestiaquae]